MKKNKIEQNIKQLRGNHISLHELVTWRQTVKCNITPGTSNLFKTKCLAVILLCYFAADCMNANKKATKLQFNLYIYYTHQQLSFEIRILPPCWYSLYASNFSYNFIINPRHSLCLPEIGNLWLCLTTTQHFWRT